ncbi:hypothetical protein K469DRAFT_700748 [Zopfia rhizophila CBS 207.26]|uniref:Uncharacterized protein n=1 Tax=Zopfia rhizophila CBS 207.26 TaxID=1314779 RepID=A0A6A6EFB7_9PEZI|nr:hypothetical protein K469DRAFT_700748 [Zopfia rhizophila CBS 207.26]
MYPSRFFSLSALAALLSLAVADPNSVCQSFGVDFVDDQHYFINTLSSESFTCVSTFEGCNKDVADVLLVDPKGDEYLCSQIPTTPDSTPEMSTCPILKSQMVSGDWMILILGNNGDGNPFAWQRDIALDCGPQATTTVTPTVTFNITTTPTITSTSTSTLTITSTFGPTATFTIPSATAKRAKTSTPPPVTTTQTKTFTKNLVTWTKDLKITTKTVTASCTLPPKPGHPDKTCTYSPTKLHPAALVSQTPTAKAQRYVRKVDRAVNVEYARSRIEAAKLRRELNARDAAAQLEERAPDAPTTTITAGTPTNTTITYSAPPVTTTESTLASTTVSATLPPVTVYSGIYTSTVTLPTPTKTRLAFTYTTAWTTKTISATWTRTTTVTPTASVTECKKIGGHIGKGRL